ncbi:DMT family transporter [Sporolactobacillus vineae]|uniref:DMT family transporter n=1 Tax=Sporolactobacillus vineae TaxID=444463 RepID=UPI000288E65E|nr:DMT family transporter [Sporolactobacillus vineae]
MNKSIFGAIYLSVAAGIWGGMYVVSKYVLQFVSPLALVWIRYLLGAGVLFLILLFQWLRTGRRQHLSCRSWLMLLWIGFIGYFVSIVCQFIGTKWSDAHTGSIITSATPAFVVIFARLVLKEKITWRRLVALLTATAGVVITIGIPNRIGQYFLGCLILVAAAVTWALLSVFVRMASAQLPSLTITAYAMLFALLFTTPFMVRDWNAGSVHLNSAPVIIGILYLGIVSTAGAFFLWNKGLSLIDASVGSLFLFFQPLVGTFLGWLPLGEKLSPGFVFGGALILAGVALASTEKTA